MAKLCPDRKYELSNGQQQQAISIYFFLEGLGFIEIVKGLGANNVLCETFCAKRFVRKFWAKRFGRNVLGSFFFGTTFCIWGWVLGWAGGWAGLGWVLGWVGAGLGAGWAGGWSWEGWGVGGWGAGGWLGAGLWTGGWGALGAGAGGLGIGAGLAGR